MGFHFMGLLVSLLILLPNLVYFIFPPRDVPEKFPSLPWHLTVLEQIGRYACFALPLIFGKQIAAQPFNFLAMLMGICVAFYYICWIRYFTSGRGFALLFKPLWHLPVPMALFPVLYYILLGLWLGSLLFLIPALMLCIGHLAISWRTYQYINGSAD